MITWTLVFFTSVLLVLFQAYLSNCEHLLFYTDITREHFGPKAVPFIAHTGMWGDMLIISPLVATIMAKYGHQWSSKEIWMALGAGFALSAVMHYTYIKAPYPEAHVHDGSLTEAGWVHLVYMALAFAVITLFYLDTSHPSTAFVWVSTVLLTFHVVLGVHVPMKLWGPEYFPYEGIWNAGTLVPILGSAAILSGLSLYAVR